MPNMDDIWQMEKGKRRCKQRYSEYDRPTELYATRNLKISGLEIVRYRYMNSNDFLLRFLRVERVCSPIGAADNLENHFGKKALFLGSLNICCVQSFKIGNVVDTYLFRDR